MSIFLILAVVFLMIKKCRYFGYLFLVCAFEVNNKNLGFTETEIMLNDIGMLLYFLLVEFIIFSNKGVK